MRKLLTITSLLLGLLSARAEVLLVEDFDYNFGKNLTQCGMWYVEYSGENTIEISNGLEFAGYAQSGIGNGALINTEGSSGMPHITFGKVTSGCVYVAMMIQGTLPPDKGGWILSLRDNHIWEQTYNENCRLLINADNQLGASVSKPTGIAEYDTTMMDSQRTYLAVLKYEIVAGKNNDRTSLYVLDSICASEPQTPTVGPLTDSSVADIEPYCLLLRGFDDEAWILVDGIRVATTWAEALGVEPTDLDCLYPLPTTHYTKIIRDGRLIIQHQNGWWNIDGTPIK